MTSTSRQVLSLSEGVNSHPSFPGSFHEGVRPAIPLRRWPAGLTHVCTLIATLHDGSVDACNQPRAQEAADEQPGEAGTQTQQHIVEKQEVVEVVERFPADRSRQEEAKSGKATAQPALALARPGVKLCNSVSQAYDLVLGGRWN